MRSLILALTTVLMLVGLPFTTASAQSDCSGTRVAREPVYVRVDDKAAYIHLYYDDRNDIACAFLNSTNDTWGKDKHMTIQLKQCAQPAEGYGGCNGQLQSTASGGRSKYRSPIAKLTVSRGCILALGVIWWGDNYGKMATKPVCMSR
jgi:hypothetical protein